MNQTQSSAFAAVGEAQVLAAQGNRELALLIGSVIVTRYRSLVSRFRGSSASMTIGSGNA